MEDKSTSGRISQERGKKVWLLKNKEGKIIDRTITKKMANQIKKNYEKNYFIDLIIERENFWKK
jgi:hypothetical protein